MHHSEPKADRETSTGFLRCNFVIRSSIMHCKIQLLPNKRSSECLSGGDLDEYSTNDHLVPMALVHNIRTR
ncbi:hypothetical protein OIU76_013480 [Salix suchowensis]|nr:hypothetical protein OIU76_013480 [Salix suchowensis]